MCTCMPCLRGAVNVQYSSLYEMLGVEQLIATLIPQVQTM